MAELFAQGQQLPETATMAPVTRGNELEFDEEAVSPEEQATYTQFVLRAQEYMAKRPDAVIDHMSNSKRPVFQNVGRTGLMIAKEIAKTAKAKGQEISADIMFHGGQEIVEMLMELGNSAGLWPFKQSSKQYDEAQAMAFMHGAELAGKDVLAGPDAAKHTEEAGTQLAREIAVEQDRGEVPDEFWEKLKGGVQNRGKSEGELLIAAGQQQAGG